MPTLYKSVATGETTEKSMIKLRLQYGKLKIELAVPVSALLIFLAILL